MLSSFFEEVGLDFEIYTNGTLLIKRLEELNPEKIGLVITDIEMPGTDGYQVASFVKNNKKLAHIPVIVNSSMTTDAVRSKMTQVGVDGFVGKTDIQNLFRLTKKLLIQ